jgi:Sulfatase
MAKVQNQLSIFIRKSLPLFFDILFFTTVFVFIEISFFIQCNQGYFADFLFTKHTLHMPLSIFPGIFFTLFIQLIIHFLFIVFTWIITILILQNYPSLIKKSLHAALMIWLLEIMLICLANQHYVPNSNYSSLMSTFLTDNQSLYLFYMLLGSYSIILLLACYSLIKHYLNAYTMIFVTIAAVLLFVTQSPIKKTHLETAATETKPNIFLIGIDSLRPDFLSYFGGRLNTPFLHDFLKQAMVFNEAMTPIARTFPSWISILTGEYPPQNGIRTNLAKQNNLNRDSLLSSILQQHGYETIYASDETRFSNINQSMGFHHIVTPPIGLNDFLIGSLNDFPLSNLLVNLKLGRWLFPYNYGNRGAQFTYDPNSFLNLLAPFLSEKKAKPIFLAIHFCLPHFPYFWVNKRLDDLNIIDRYSASVERVDEQIKLFFSLLEENHLLDHAIVVLLSDHGEALELSGDRLTERRLFQAKTPLPKFYPPSLDNEDYNQSAGHGTDVLSLSQSHTLLAFKLYGFESQKIGAVSGRVSLIDIKPTILHFLSIQKTGSGLALNNIILGKANVMPRRDFFIETDFTPEAIRTIYPETKKVLLESINFFEIDPKLTQITVKPELVKMIIDSKQYAIISGNWMLALYPVNKTSQMPILINLKNGKWTNYLRSPFAEHSPAKTMLNKLKEFYGDEIKI